MPIVSDDPLAVTVNRAEQEMNDAARDVAHAVRTWQLNVHPRVEEALARFEACRGVYGAAMDNGLRELRRRSDVTERIEGAQS